MEAARDKMEKNKILILEDRVNLKIENEGILVVVRNVGNYDIGVSFSTEDTEVSSSCYKIPLIFVPRADKAYEEGTKLLLCGTLDKETSRFMARVGEREIYPKLFSFSCGERLEAGEGKQVDKLTIREEEYSLVSLEDINSNIGDDEIVKLLSYLT